MHLASSNKLRARLLQLSTVLTWKRVNMLRANCIDTYNVPHTCTYSFKHYLRFHVTHSQAYMSRGNIRASIIISFFCFASRDENMNRTSTSNTTAVTSLKHTQIHSFILTYTHACMHAYIHTDRHTCMHAYIHTYTLTVLKCGPARSLNNLTPKIA